MKRVGFRLTIVGPERDDGMSSWHLESIHPDGEWFQMRHGVSSSFPAAVSEGKRALAVEAGIREMTNPDLGVVAPGTPNDEIPFASPETIHAAPAQVAG